MPPAFTSARMISASKQRARSSAKKSSVSRRTTSNKFENAAQSSADYIAVGPIFSTSSKVNPDPVVGTKLLQQVRKLTDKPIVAIGGIKLENAAEVIAAGADSVAVISDILAAPDRAARAKQYLELLGNSEAQKGMSA